MAIEFSGKDLRRFRSGRRLGHPAGQRLKTASAERRAREGGNTMVEAALVFMPMMIFLLGIVDVSLSVYIQSTLTTAAREGTRFAITYSSSYNGNSCATSQAACTTQVVQYNAMGFLSGTNASYITVNYYTANDLTNPAESCAGGGSCTVNPNGVSTASMPQTLSNGTVVSYVNQPGNIVEVVITGYPWNWLFPVHNWSASQGYTVGAPSINLGAESADVLGALAVGVTVPPSP